MAAVTSPEETKTKKYFSKAATYDLGLWIGEKKVICPFRFNQYETDDERIQEVLAKDERKDTAYWEVAGDIPSGARPQASPGQVTSAGEAATQKLCGDLQQELTKTSSELVSMRKKLSDTEIECDIAKRALEGAKATTLSLQEANGNLSNQVAALKEQRTAAPAAPAAAPKKAK